MADQSIKSLLLDIAAGKASPEDLEPKDDGWDYSKFTTEELKQFLSLSRSHGEDVTKWPVQARVDLIKTVRELPQRKSWAYDADEERNKLLNIIKQLK